MYATEKIFEDVFQRYGIRWRPDQSPDQYDGAYCSILLDFMKKALESQKRVQGPKGPIFFDFIYNPSFNALATTDSGHELITLFTGSASHLLAAHHCLLSDPETLPAVGKAKNERLSTDALDLFKNCNPLQEPHHHPSGERFEVATCLVWLSCIYILLHEVGHIVRCHPSYMEQ